jgi:hypothetical protein
MIPTITEFDPRKIKWQLECTRFIRKEYDYSLGSLEVLLSGSVGSAKSLEMAHLVATHCLMYPNAEVLLGRLAMPHLKQTILQMIIDHLGDDVPYSVNMTTGIITFPNKSKIVPVSWQDKKFKKVRSYQPSMIAIEELTESDTNEAYRELRMRLGRRPDIPESIMIMATNPDSPSHWVHEEIIQRQNQSRRVFYSVTEQNPFLPKTYVETLKETLSDKEVRRMIYGEWVDLVTEVIYYNYKKDINYVNEEYVYNPRYPIDLCFDFNIGIGKPLSAGLGQYIGGHFHCSKDYVIHGARTQDVLEEMADNGEFDHINRIRVFGDAAGKHSDTRANRSDYDIIYKFLENFSGKRGRLYIEKCVPRGNPRIRDRHNLANAMFQNANGKVNVTVYKGADVTDKGFRLAKLKKNGNYIEDDTDEHQHITTARTYWFYHQKKFVEDQANARIVIR